jgi:hypothetical protein
MVRVSQGVSVKEGEFPYGVADVLRYARDVKGMTFDEAWAELELDREARLAGFGRTNRRPFSVESTLSFAKRHLRAAYDRTPTMRYCEEDCPYLAVIDNHCAIHAHDERVAA